MSEAAIFIYGLAVFTIVSAACGLIVFGILEERRSREHLDAGPDARDPDREGEAPASGGPEARRAGEAR